MTRVSGIQVSDAGITLRARDDVPLDLTFDDQRIGSFWSRADTERSGRERVWAWPSALQARLDGVTRLGLKVHGTDELLFDDEVSFGDGEERLRIVDNRGNPLGLDKSMKLMRLFESRSSDHLAPLLDALDDVLAALRDVGLQPFLAYGTLLGAVREGQMIGHDSDADLGYVSAHSHPVDVMLESFEVQRRLTAKGYHVARYSGCALKVSIEEGDGTLRGLDVFGGFMREGTLYLMGEVGHPFRQEWLYPLTTATLDGRNYPVPAAPEHLLEGMYGPSWRVPDPAYKFTTPRSTTRRLTGWFRGIKVFREEIWLPYFSDPAHRRNRPLSDLAAWVHEHEDHDVAVIDIGCGAGTDAFRLAKAGRTVVGLDYLRRGYRTRRRKAERKALPVTYGYANLNELRSAVAAGLDLRRAPGPKAVMARHVADATDAFGRRNLLRLARLALGDGGRLYVEVVGRAGARGAGAGLRPVRVERFKRQAAGLGASLVDETWTTGRGGEQPAVCRLVFAWPDRAADSGQQTHDVAEAGVDEGGV